MKNRLLLIISLLFTIQFACVEPLFSAPVDSITARKAATRFYNWKTGRSVDENFAQLVYIQQTNPQSTGLQTAPVNALYVFNFDNHFVMMSADTRVIPVLAYSTESGFNADGLPGSLDWFLDEYVREIESILRSISDFESETTMNEWNHWLSGEVPMMATAANVGPLLQTLWDQNSPYNSLCPEDPNGPGGHTYAGCVACALAQIIRYWQYPSSGIGSHTYTANYSSYSSYYGDYGTQSVDFSATTYDYSLMPLSLNSGSTSAQINEVAKLMYHCGVAVEMMYGANGSGAFDNMAANALISHFGYNGVTIKNKNSYTDINWLNLIKNELNNLRPVYYSGNNTGGHAFVCDGYDSEDMLHFNWGWRGSYNGYYTVASLNPGTYDFSGNQMAIIGIDASQPMVHTGSKSLSFLTEADANSDSKSVSVLGANLDNPITASVTGSFKISNNNLNFFSIRTLNSNGGTLYVRYEPTINSGSESGYIVLTSGSIIDTIYLSGIVYDPYPHCLPPENLTISSQNLQDITIQWDAPVIAPDPHTLTWSSNSANMSYGSGSEYKKSMLQRFCDTDLVAYHNQALTKIRFYAKSGATTYKAVVYKGGSYNGAFNPGTLVLSQDINLSTLTMDTWNTVTLNTPVVVDATQELWFGVYMEAPGGSYCMPLSPQPMPKKGSICGTHTSNSVTWSELFGDDYSFCIQGTVDNAQVVTDYLVSRDGTVIGTTTSTSIQDHVNSTGTYTYVVKANWNNGCEDSAQMSFTNIAHILATPEALDFFSNYGHGTLVKTVIVGGNGLNESIMAQVSGNFQISTNGTNYSYNQSLPSTGGTLYVKYVPASSDSEYESGLVTLTSGSLTTTVPLSGQCYAGCNAPQNLVISQSASTMNLSWDAPEAQVIQQENLTWLEAESSTNTGYASNMSLFIAQRFDTDDLASLHGKRLTEVSFIPNSAVTNYKIVVFKGGGTYNNYYLTSGTQVVNQNVNISTLTAGVWNSIALESPVTIDASQELWFGLYFEAPASSYPIRFATPYVAKKGCLVRDASSSLWNEYRQNTYCFALKATIEDAPITLTHYQIDRNETTLGNTGNTSYTDNVIYNGEYDYDVWAVWSNGCRMPVRGSVTVSGLCDPQGEAYTVEACESYTWHGEAYTTSGTYIYAHTGADGCPIIDTLHLTVNHATAATDVQEACNTFTWIDGISYTESTDEPTFTLTNAAGCDSVVTLNLSIHHSDTTEFSQTSCYTSSGTG